MKLIKRIVRVLTPKRISYQVGLVFGLMLAVVLFILGYSLINTSKTAVRESVLRDYENISRQAAKELSGFISKPRDVLISGAGVMGTVMHEPESRKLLIYQSISDYPAIFERITLAGLDGQMMVSSDLVAAPKDYSGLAVFRDVIKTRRVAVSPVYFSAERVPYIAIAVPVSRLNELTGVVIGEVKLNHIWKTLSEIKLDQAEVFLVDEAGYVLVHGEEKRVYRGENMSDSGAVQSALQGRAGSVEEARPGASSSDGRWLTAYAPVTPFGWGLIIRQPLSTAYAFAYRMQRTAAGIIVVSILIALLLSLMLARWITRPVMNLTAVTAKVAGGDLTQEIKSDRADEIGRLINSFGEMTRKLRRAKHAEKLSAIGLATSKIAHELRNPLAAVKAFIQMLPRRHQDEGFIAQFQSTVPPEMNRLENMLGTMTGFSGVQKLNLASGDVNLLLKGTLELFREQMARQKITTLSRCEPAEINLLMDADKIKQVVINLVRNSLEAMPAGGCLDISVRVCLNGLHPAEPVKTAEITIADTGCGMDQTQVTNVFEPFTTSKRGGLGLGLAICKEIIEQHQGTITLTSRPGQGTVFTLKLPVRS